MKKVIVVPVIDGVLSGHFGHSAEFYFATVEDNKIIEEKMLTPPPHESGVYPKWVKEQGGDLVITGGMGPKAANILKENQVEVITGGPSELPRKVVEDYLAGVLKTQANSCNHDHHHHHHHHHGE